MVKWSALLPTVWERGANESTVVNHLRTSHYHLGLICTWCLDYFTTSADTINHYSQLCKQALAGIKEDDEEDQEGESDIDHKGEDDNDFMFG